jgi:hypothetical protein
LVLSFYWILMRAEDPRIINGFTNSMERIELRVSLPAAGYAAGSRVTIDV